MNFTSNVINRKNLGLISILIGLILFLGPASAFWTDQQSGEIGVISLEGQIMPGQPGLSAAGITPNEVREKVDQAEAEGSDAILVEINSGGGSVVASRDVKRIIDNTEVYTVCRLRDIGASGAYMAALGCDKIVADDLTLTGSVGVTASYLEFSELLEELGIDYVEIKSGEDKEQGNPLTQPTQEDIDELTNRTESVHETFKEMVLDERDLDNEELIHSGSVVLGREAEEAGMIDELGGRETAVELAENETGLELRQREVTTGPEFSFFDLLLGGIHSRILSESEIKLEASL